MNTSPCPGDAGLLLEWSAGPEGPATMEFAEAEELRFADRFALFCRQNPRWRAEEAARLERRRQAGLREEPWV